MNTVKIYGFRYSVTGVFGYDYYSDGKKVCTATSMVMPSPPVRINGFDKSLYSEFDQEKTIDEGVSRIVYDERAHELFRVIYRDYGEYEILMNRSGFSFNVCCGGRTLCFYSEREIITLLQKIPKKIFSMRFPFVKDPDYADSVDAFYTAEFLPDTDKDVMMAILSFPMLRFFM